MLRDVKGTILKIQIFTMVCVLISLVIIFATKVAYGDPPVRLMSVDQEREITLMLPTINDDGLARRTINSEDLIWYTDTEMIPAYQLQNSFHSPFYNVSSENEQDLSGRRIGKDRIGNGNRDFPWATTAGTDKCENVEIFRFAKFPKKENGSYYPMVHFLGTNPGSNLMNPNNRNRVLGEGGGATSQQKWIYPRGMVFGELLCMHGPDDMLYPFELRLRYRERDFWEVDAYRNYRTARELEVAVKELRPDWWDNPTLVNLINNLRNPKIENDSVQDINRNITGFSARFKKHVLPPINDNKLVAELLTTANWGSAIGNEWVPGVTAPTVPKGTAFHIVPEEYAAHMVAVDSQACNNCHTHTGHNVRTFDQNRGWYGRIRGNDRIISHHPIDASSISYDGRNKPVRFRPDYVQAGLVEAFDPKKHTDDRYVLCK